MYKKTMEKFWTLFFRFQNDENEIEKINCHWGRKVNVGLIDTVDINDGIEDWDSSENHDTLHAKAFKTLKKVEVKISDLHEMLSVLEEALRIKRLEAKDELKFGGSIREETKDEGKKLNGLKDMILGQMDYWTNIQESILREDEDDTDTRPVIDGGYNKIHWGEVIRRGEILIDWAHRQKDVQKIFNGLKRVDELRKKRHLTYEAWLKLRYILNVNIMRHTTNSSLKEKAMHFAVQARTMLKEKESKKVNVEQEDKPIFVTMAEITESYSVDVENILDAYHSILKLAKANKCSVFKMQCLLEDEQ